MAADEDGVGGADRAQDRREISEREPLAHRSGLASRMRTRIRAGSIAANTLFAQLTSSADFAPDSSARACASR